MYWLFWVVLLILTDLIHNLFDFSNLLIILEWLNLLINSSVSDW